LVHLAGESQISSVDRLQYDEELGATFA
jgi:hypothetical protein